MISSKPPTSTLQPGAVRPPQTRFVISTLFFTPQEKKRRSKNKIFIEINIEMNYPCIWAEATAVGMHNVFPPGASGDS